jgi:exoribonuclease-2
VRSHFALIYLKGRPRLAHLVDEGPPHCRLALADGVEIRYPSTQILLRWEGEEPAPDEAGASLADREAALAERAPAFDLAALHAQLPKGRALPFARLAAHALPPRANEWERAALYLALLDEPSLFRHTRTGFVPRGAADTRRWTEQAAGEQARAEQLARVAEWRAMLERGDWREGGEPQASGFLDRLESLLAGERQSPHWALLAKPLRLQPGSMAEARVKLKSWLEAAGRWRGWPHIWLRRAEVSRSFSPALHKAARALAETYPHPGGRTDLRDLETFTIDSPGTRDPDDACSVLSTEGGDLTIAVHVTEPPAALRPGHPLFEEAARRTSSVYTLDGVFPMLPPALATERAALRAGKVREAATFTLHLTPAGGELVGVERSLIRVSKNLDYGEAEGLLKAHPDTWGRLAELCEALRAGRLAAGAVIGERSGVTLDRSDPERLRLIRWQREGPAQRLVEELAILTNREAGRYCRTHRLPAIYRVLLRLRGGARSGAGEGEEEGAPQPQFSVKGSPHAGLAAERYVQVTSPLRRFSDLVMQRQILEHAASGTVSYPERAQLAAWGEAADARQARYAEAERLIDGYWKQRYLAQHVGETFAAVVRRVGAGKRGRVWLEAVELAVHADLPAGVRVDDTMAVRVEEVDLDRQTVGVSLEP